MDKKTTANTTTETVRAKTLEQLALELAKVGDELTQKYDPQYKQELRSAATNLIVTIGQEVVFFLIRDGAIWKARRTESFTEMNEMIYKRFIDNEGVRLSHSEYTR